MATVQTNPTNDEVDEWTKPPFLRRVRIRGYKSIAFCDVELKPLTILVGRNAAGKSNFLDALVFLRDAMNMSVTEATRRHGGSESIRCQTSECPRIEIAIEAGFPSYKMTCLAEYSVTFAIKRHGLIEVEGEHLRISDAAYNHVCGFDANLGKAQWTGLEQFGRGDVAPVTIADGPLPYPHLFDSYRPDRLLLGVIGSQPFLDLNEGIRTAGFYNFNPEAIRQLQKPDPGSLLERDGRNLASAIMNLKELDEDTLSRVGAYLTAVVDEVESFEAVRYGEYETVRFRLRSSSAGKPLEFDSTSMSEGTLRALAALVAAFQVHLPTEPSIIGIEEPETALHPAAMRSLVDALDEATGRTQILLTTHSADLLEDRDLNPSQVLVVRNKNGLTQIAPIDPASREIIHKELYTLADLHRQDHLEPDAADLQRQAELARTNGEG